MKKFLSLITTLLLFSQVSAEHHKNNEIKSIFNGKNLEGWMAQTKDKKNQWTASDGILINPSSGVNLLTVAQYDDFKLHIEARYPKGSNSGIYLRGRYEVQVEDS